jgi:hypothetical protein
MKVLQSKIVQEILSIYLALANFTLNIWVQFNVLSLEINITGCEIKPVIIMITYYTSWSTISFTYIPQSSRNPAKAAVHCVRPSSNMRWYEVGIIKLPHTAGTSRSANKGTVSA